MKNYTRRVLVAFVALFALTLTSSGCWVVSDSEHLWQTSKGSGMHSRSQDMNAMINPHPEAGEGGW